MVRFQTNLCVLLANPFDKPSPLARGFVTYGTDSGRESKPADPPQVFALNDEAFGNCVPFVQEIAMPPSP
jgi:hypothetical protein